jgi:hypothetical protein
MQWPSSTTYTNSTLPDPYLRAARLSHPSSKLGHQRGGDFLQIG